MAGFLIFFKNILGDLTVLKKFKTENVRKQLKTNQNIFCHSLGAFY